MPTPPRFRSGWFFCLTLVIFTVGCGGELPQTKQPEDSRQVVVVDNYPLQYFVERLTDKDINAQLLAPADMDPAMWNPSPDEIAEIQSAEILFTNGAGYSKWISRVSLDEAKVINTSAAAVDNYIEIEDAVTHQHGPEGEHTHSGTAFTTWLDFALAGQQARAVANSLLEIIPESEKRLRRKVSTEIASLHADLDIFDARMKSLTKAAGQPNMLGSHPVYQYLARAYKVPMESVHWEPGETPTAAQWKEFDALLEKFPAEIMLWEGEPTAETKEKLTARGVTVVVFDPAGNRPEQGDFREIMLENIVRLEKATDAPAWHPN